MPVNGRPGSRRRLAHRDRSAARGDDDSLPYSARRNGRPPPSKCSQAFSPSRMIAIVGLFPARAAENRRPASTRRSTKSDGGGFGVPASVDESNQIGQRVIPEQARDLVRADTSAAYAR